VAIPRWKLKCIQTLALEELLSLLEPPKERKKHMSYEMEKINAKRINSERNIARKKSRKQLEM